MKRLLVLCTVFIFACQASATIRLLDNTITATGVYSTAQSVHDSCSIGDTVYIVGSGATYGALTSTKQLVWFGPGYFLGENNMNPTNPSPAQITQIALNTGSSGSVFNGISFSGSNAINVSTNNIIFRRCCINVSDATWMINLNSVNNIDFEQCYLSDVNTAWNSVPVVLNSSHNVIFRNCFIGYNQYTGTMTSSGTAGPIELTNCCITLHLSIYGASLTNCIMFGGTNNTSLFSVNNNSYTYCIGNSTQFGTANGNQQNVSFTNMWWGTPTNSDGYYRLGTNSPALGAGTGGTDCGMYGGTSPYILSGIPPIPYLKLISAPTSGTVTNGLPVTISVQGRN